jgi:hypothetical protein
MVSITISGAYKNVQRLAVTFNDTFVSCVFVLLKFRLQTAHAHVSVLVFRDEIKRGYKGSDVGLFSRRTSFKS